MIVAQAVTLRIAVGEQPSLQHFVGRKADAGHDAGRIERGLLHFREEVFRVAVELDHADFDQRVILVRPNLGEIEGMVGYFRGVGFRHDLHLERPLREVAPFDAFVEVALMALAVLADDRLGFGVGQVPDALLST